ncbi:MAG: hypothetical protein R3332_01220 [Pseudohongiellaceae bacterium]|nr:hypothetical protein [Pseudohongiellaceae bacterium]
MGKPGFLIKFGKFLMAKGALRVVIADDEDAYFNERMIGSAKLAGFPGIERIDFVTHDIFQSWLKDSPEIIILDVMNVVDEEIAKDGIELARTLKANTNSMLIVTSAHEQQLKNSLAHIDYFIENRKLTSSDFIYELNKIMDHYINVKSKFYKNVSLKIGMKLASGAASA